METLETIEKFKLDYGLMKYKAKCRSIEGDFWPSGRLSSMPESDILEVVE